MPDGKTNIYTRRQKMLMEAIGERVELLKGALKVPLGFQEVSASEYKRRWGAMTPEQRLGEIDRLGVDKVENLLLGEGNA